MPATLTTEQLTQYRNAISANGVEGAKAVYQTLYAQGYNYAGWAYGVASGETVTGQFAMDYLSGSAIMGLGGDECRNLSSQDIDAIRVDMATKYINTLISNAENNGNIIDRDVNFKETKKFHEDAFRDNGLSLDNWTLEAPMELLRQDFGDDCSGLIPPDTLMRDNKRQPLRCQYESETQLQTIPERVQRRGSSISA